METPTLRELQQMLLDLLDFYRGLVLDAVQVELGDTPSWPHVRSRILKALGDRGLGGKITGLFDAIAFGGARD